MELANMAIMAGSRKLMMLLKLKKGDNNYAKLKH